jgi:hypothetical protein
LYTGVWDSGDEWIQFFIRTWPYGLDGIAQFARMRNNPKAQKNVSFSSWMVELESIPEKTEAFRFCRRYRGSNPGVTGVR